MRASAVTCGVINIIIVTRVRTYDVSISAPLQSSPHDGVLKVTHVQCYSPTRYSTSRNRYCSNIKERHPQGGASTCTVHVGSAEPGEKTGLRPSP